jgi:hypothetical protein
MHHPRKPPLKGFIFFLLRPFMFVFGLIVVEGYKTFFGWWLDKRVAQRNQDRLAHDIREKLAFLFAEYSATAVPNDASLPFPPGFDYAVVTVVAGNVRFQFFRGRGEFRVDVAPQHDPSDLNEISTVLRAIGAVEGPQTQPLYQEPRDFGRLLRTHFDRLDKSFSETEYPTTKENLHPIQERNYRAVRAMEAKIQRGW